MARKKKKASKATRGRGTGGGSNGAARGRRAATTRARAKAPHLPDHWPASRVEARRVSELSSAARNARTHTPAQVKKLAASIEEWGWTNPVLVDERGGIVAGHGRVLAAEQLGIEEVPVIVARGWTEAQRRAYALADNRLALDAGWDDGILALELAELAELDFELGLTGFSLDEIGTIVSGYARGGGGAYSIKIESPVYEPTGEEPEVEDLFDERKAAELVERIAAADLPADVRRFLEIAATRHVRFDYGRIAEWYCHASPELQELIEDSALVIVDFKRAIEGGYVRVCERIRALADAALEAEEAED